MKKIPIISQNSAQLKKPCHTCSLMLKTMASTSEPSESIASECTMNKVPVVSHNSAQLEKDDHTFFLLRRKASTSEYSNAHQDIICVVRDSYANHIYKDIENVRRREEYGDTYQNDTLLPLNKTPDLFTETLEKPVEEVSTSLLNPGCPISESIRSYDTCNNNKNNHDSYSTDGFNLELFTIYLTRFFGINPYSSISYVDDDDKVHSVQTETEFTKLWQFARSCSKRSKGVLLLIDIPSNQVDSMAENKQNGEIPVDDQKCLNLNNLNLSETFKLEGNMDEVEHNKVQYSNGIHDLNEETDNNTLNNKGDPIALSPNLTNSTCSKILTKSFANMKLESTVPLNINGKDFVNDICPTWFVQYMEELKKDIITEVSDQIMQNVMANLTNCSTKSAICTKSKDISQCENHSHHLRPKCNQQRNTLFTDQKRQYKRKKRDTLVERFCSEIVDNPFVNYIKSKNKQVKAVEENLEYSSELDEDKEKENVHDRKCNSSELLDNIDNLHEQNNIAVKKQIVNKHQPIFTDFHMSQSSSKESLFNVQKTSNAIKDNEFRMNCSITEHQMLDNCSTSDTENISVHSDNENCSENDFEVVPIPMKCETNINCHDKRNLSKRENIKCSARKADESKNNEYLASFDMLPEISSPSSSIGIAENHFTTNSNNIPIRTTNSDENEYLIRKDNIDMHLSNISGKCISNTSVDITDKISSLLIKSTSTPTDENLNSLNMEDQRTDPNDMKIDVNSSHTSYLTSEPVNPIYFAFPTTQHSCQAQADLDDLTMSFHSHTTSITDNDTTSTPPVYHRTNYNYSKQNLSQVKKSTIPSENRIRKRLKEFSNQNVEKNTTTKESNAKNSKHIMEETATDPMPEIAESVHILPETLVNGALHIASIAYGTAREAIVKMRSTSRDHRSSHARHSKETRQ